jgi:hypothetical protein
MAKMTRNTISPEKDLETFARLIFLKADFKSANNLSLEE